ncbi:MFS general substrate transporter [Teratosphaeria destructans]|uniref:MFS general substrate transporter n=1 Tax=Teratosphaeria destructans TaxID=418781 RepID=A0A9W7W6W5_9PEZI|nr:MFS general substrate transporter [Teratosphaeria destructans]
MQHLSPVLIVGVVFLATFVSTLGSSVSVGDGSFTTKHFGVPPSHAPLIVGFYLSGSAPGPLVVGPMSERYGRRLAIWSGTAILTAFATASAAAPSWSTFLAFRLLAGFGSAASMVVAGGIVADVVPDAGVRGNLLSWLMVNNTLGSTFGTMVSTAVAKRWPDQWNAAYWLNGGAAGLSLVLLLCLPKSRKHDGSGTHDENATTAHAQALELKLTRQFQLTLPLRMLFLEPIVSFACLSMSAAQSTYYLLFEFLPPTFSLLYEWTLDSNHKIFAPLVAGAVLAGITFTVLDPKIQVWVEKSADQQRALDSRRLPGAGIGGVLIVMSLFLMGYAVSTHKPAAVILLAEGIFGFGFLLLYMCLTNYVADTYKIWIASAMAPLFLFRNLAGAAVNFAATPIWKSLGPSWTYLVLGFMIIPFAMLLCWSYLFAPWLRQHSKFGITLAAD